MAPSGRINVNAKLLYAERCLFLSANSACFMLFLYGLLNHFHFTWSANKNNQTSVGIKYANAFLSFNILLMICKVK